jgi:regulatory protein
MKTLMEKAGAYLARRPRTRAELRRLLAPLAGESEIETALDRLAELKLLNDAEYAYNLGFRRSTQEAWGPLRIRQELLRRQIAPDVVELTVARILRENPEERVLAGYLDRHCRQSGIPADPKGIRRLVQHLQRRGFHDDAILKALRRNIPEAL